MTASFIHCCIVTGLQLQEQAASVFAHAYESNQRLDLLQASESKKRRFQILLLHFACKNENRTICEFRLHSLKLVTAKFQEKITFYKP